MKVRRLFLFGATYTYQNAINGVIVASICIEVLHKMLRV